MYEVLDLIPDTHKKVININISLLYLIFSIHYKNLSEHTGDLILNQVQEIMFEKQENRYSKCQNLSHHEEIQKETLHNQDKKKLNTKQF